MVLGEGPTWEGPADTVNGGYAEEALARADFPSVIEYGAWPHFIVITMRPSIIPFFIRSKMLLMFSSGSSS
jgi:hypothetical protein